VITQRLISKIRDFFVFLKLVGYFIIDNTMQRKQNKNMKWYEITGA
jgi:hypothetical protein